jgi:mannose/fructose/N-acetylgalactosamine-specific phosphotransferase system component IIC
MNLVDALPIVVLGGVLGLDVVTFPQAMFARPLVAATVAGAFAGNAMGGLFLGAILELIALETLPFGASRYPEWGSASVVGGAVYASQPGLPSSALAAGVLASLLTASVRGGSMVTLRRMNASRAAKLQGQLDAGSSSAVMGLQLFGLTGDLIRGMLVTLGGLLVFAPLTAAIVRSWHGDDELTRATVAAIAAAVAAGAVWKIFHSVSRARLLFVAGALVGAAILLRQ